MSTLKLDILSDPPWPRILLKTDNSKVVRLYNCSVSGNVEVTVITKNKNGTDLHACAKLSGEGDLLPAVSTVEYQRRARHKNTAEED
jgi:hypothetical protein